MRILTLGRSLRLVSAGVIASAVGLGLAGGCGTPLLTHADEFRAQGLVSFNQGNYPDAAGAFGNAIKQDPRDYKSYYYLGRSYHELKNFHQSVSNYRMSLDTQASSIQARADTDFRQKTLDGLAAAIAAGGDSVMEAGLSNPQQPSAEDRYLLAKVMRIRGDADSAIDSYNQAALLEPNNVLIAKEYGLYLLQLGQSQKAASELKRAYVLDLRARKTEDPQVTAALRQLGIVPGPSLGDERDLNQPLIPVGPIPEVDLNKIGIGGQATTGQ